MGEIRVKALLHNDSSGGRRRRRGLEIDAVVDTGAVMTLLPQEVAEKLGLKSRSTTIVQLANDQRIELPCSQGFRLTIAGREMFTDCLIGPPGCTPLIGQLVMERLDLIADPGRRTLTVRPESPYLPTLNMRSA
jgi:clan AA aspartic protease